jgi:hypothetical protein
MADAVILYRLYQLLFYLFLSNNVVELHSAKLIQPACFISGVKKKSLAAESGCRYSRTFLIIIVVSIYFPQVVAAVFYNIFCSK